MTSSGTYTFNPAISDLVIEAFERCGIRGPALTHEHMLSARMSANLELQTWSNRQVNLWKVELHDDIALVQGDSTYALDADVISVLDVYVRTTVSGVNTDRIMTPMSRTEYANISNKGSEGPPTQYWFERTNAPQINLWLVPNDTYTLRAYVLRRMEDAAPTMGQTLDVNYRFVDAFAAGMAKRLSLKWAADRYDRLKGEADQAWAEAAIEDREIVDSYIRPDVSGYFKG